MKRMILVILMLFIASPVYAAFGQGEFGDVSGGSASASGNEGNIQFTDGSDLQGDDDLSWNTTTKVFQLGGTTATTQQILPSSNDAVTPTLAFGDGDTGFYESADDVLVVSANGTVRGAFGSTGATSGFYAGTGVVGNPLVIAEASTATNPVHTFYEDVDTGIGRGAADVMSFISGGVEIARVLTNSGSSTSEIRIVQNDTGWLTGTDSAGTGVVNIVKVNSADEAEFGSTITNVGGYKFEEDSGAVTAMNMPVSATPAAGTEESMSFSVDSTVIAKVYAEADSSGGIQNPQVQITGDCTVSDCLTVSNQATIWINDSGVEGVSANAGLIIENNANTWIQLSTGNANKSGIFFGDPENSSIGRMLYDHAENDITWTANAAERMVLEPDGDLYISNDLSMSNNATESGAGTGPTTYVSIFIDGIEYRFEAVRAS